MGILPDLIDECTQPKIEHVNTLDIKDLKKRLRNIGGSIKYIIVTKANEGYDLHPRPNQPCLGGLLRKYGDTHDDCTRPSDERPNDLYYPFPDGRPVALAYHFLVETCQTAAFEAMFSDDSPWIRGFGGSENIEFIPAAWGGYTYEGFYLKSGDFDPTVLVNCLRNFRGIAPELYDKCIERGLSRTEALTFCVLFYNVGGDQYSIRQSAYSFDPYSSVKRMLEKNPVNLTGGTWGNRFDYNRPKMACVFRPPEGELSIPLGKTYKERTSALHKFYLNFDECHSLMKDAATWQNTNSLSDATLSYSSKLMTAGTEMTFPTSSPPMI